MGILRRKKSWYIFLVTTMILGLLFGQMSLYGPGVDAAAAAETGGFTDVAADTPNSAFINYLAQQGVISGFPDQTFRPLEGVTRAQAAVVLARSLNLDTQGITESGFGDVPVGHWAFAAVGAAVRDGYLSGYPDGTFRPDQPITRAEGISLAMRLSREPLPAVALPQLEDLTNEHWAAGTVAAALDAGIAKLKDKTRFEPAAELTRGDLARAFAVSLTLSPGPREAVLVGRLVPNKGTVRLKQAQGREFQAIAQETTVRLGDTILTEPGASAKLNFDDGTSILLQPGTELTIKKDHGTRYIKKNGQPGVRLDLLTLEMLKGKAFFGLAVHKKEEVKKETTVVEPGPQTMASARSSGMEIKYPDSQVRLAQSDLPWWKQPQETKVRLEFDMPWGVCGVRGTFGNVFSNEDGSGGANFLTGSGTVTTSGGEQSDLQGGQSADVDEDGGLTTGDMDPDDYDEWTDDDIQDWAEDTADNMDDNAPNDDEGDQPDEGQDEQDEEEDDDSILNQIREALDNAQNQSGQGNQGNQGSRDSSTPSVTISGDFSDRTMVLGGEDLKITFNVSPADATVDVTSSEPGILEAQDPWNEGVEHRLTLHAVKVGSTVVTVTASKEGYSSRTRAFKVTVVNLGHPWPMYHYNSRNTGLSPYNGPQSSVVELVYDTGQYSEMTSSPVVDADGNIYTTLGNTLYGFSPQGTILWDFEVPESTPCVAPAIGTDGTVYIAFDNVIYALNPMNMIDNDPEILWDSSEATIAGTISSSLTVAPDGIIYAVTDNQMLYALYPDGNLKWQFESNYCLLPPAVGEDGTVCVSAQGDGCSALFAVSQDDLEGTKLWESNTDYISGSPVIADDGTIYLATDCGLYAINPNGNEKWFVDNIVDDEAEEMFTIPAIGPEGTLYVGSYNTGQIYAINHSNGSVIWASELPTDIGGITSPVVGADGTIYAAVYDGCNQKSKLYALDPENGTVNWWLELEDVDVTYSSLAIADGKLYICSDDGCLYAIKENPGSIRLSHDSYEVDEGEQVQILVERVGGTSGKVSVDYTTNSISAEFGDYIPVTGTLTFENGEAEKEIIISTREDGDGDNDKFEIILSNVAGGASIISPSTAEISISDTGSYVGGLSVTAVNAALGATNVGYKIRFISYGNLEPADPEDPGNQGDSVIINFPSGYTVPATINEDYIKVNGSAASSILVNLNQVTVFLSETIFSGEMVEVEFLNEAGINNPTSGGCYEFTVSTTANPDEASASIWIPSISNLQVSSYGIEYHVSFTTPSDLEIGDTITIVFPEEYDLTEFLGEEYDPVVVSINDGEGRIASVYGQDLTITLDSKVIEGQVVDIWLNSESIVYPEIPSLYTFEVYTSEDSNPAFYSAFLALF